MYYLVRHLAIYKSVSERERRDVPDKKKMGRPIIGEPKDICIQLRLDKSTLEKLDVLCQKKNVSRSELMRNLIKKAK